MTRITLTGDQYILFLLFLRLGIMASVAGVLVTTQARLVLDDPNGPDDRDQARYVLGVGADYWLSLAAQWDQWKTNGDVGIGRFRYVTPEWQTYTMSSLDEAELRQNPPPVQDLFD